jgi:hypothetical protein
LINDEVTQQQQQQMNGNGGQRSRMAPPPGFNHIQNSSFNSFGAAASPRSQCEFLFLTKKMNENGSKFDLNFNAKTERREMITQMEDDV